MKRLEISRKDIYAHSADVAGNLQAKLSAAGFKMIKPIKQRHDIERDFMIYTQEDEDVTKTAGPETGN